MSDMAFCLLFLGGTIVLGLAFAIVLEVWLRRSAHCLNDEYACNHSNCICGPGLVVSGTCILGGDPWVRNCPKFTPTVGD